MNYFKYISILALIGAVAMVAAPADAPVEIAYVYSESMEPTIQTGDGYIVVPAGAVERGDIVTFWSDYRREYVTHRLVGETEGGFLTQGDNNPSTDQAVGHPPVERADIVGKVLTIDGSPLIIPSLGTLVDTVGNHRPLLGGLLGLLVLVQISSASGTTLPSRPVTDSAELIHLLFAVGIIAGTGIVFLTGSTIAFPLAGTAGGAPADAVVLDGDGTSTVNFTVADVPFTQRTVSATGVTIVDQRTSGETLSLVIEADDRDGTATVRFYQYPAVMPLWMLERTQAIHPLLAAVCTVSLTFVPVYLLWLTLFAGGAPIRKPSWRVPWWARGR